MTSRNAAPRCSNAALISGTSCALSPEKLRATNEAPSSIAMPTRSIGSSARAGALLALRAAVGGGRELALGQAVDAVVLDDIDHVDAAPHRMGELAEPDRGGVAVAGNAEIDQVAVGEIGAGQHRRHAAVHRIEAVALAQHVGRRLRRAADAAELGDPVRRQAQFEAGVDDRRADRVVAAAGAERRHRAFVVAVGEAERVDGDRGVVKLRLAEIGHETASRACAATGVAQAAGDLASDEAGGDRHRRRNAGSRSGAPGRRSRSVVISVRICASRFCSTTKTCSCASTKSATSGAKRKGADAQRVDMQALGRQQVAGLVHRRRRRAEIDDADPRRLRRALRRTGRGRRLRAVSNLRSSRSMLST